MSFLRVPTSSKRLAAQLCKQSSALHAGPTRLQLSYSWAASLSHSASDAFTVASRSQRRQLHVSPQALAEAQQTASAGAGPAPPALDLGELIVTGKAASRLASIREKNAKEGKPGAEGLYLRLRVDSGGCSGFKYAFTLEHAPLAADDRVFERDGGRVVVDEVSLGMVKGATVDWEDSGLMKASFAVINNPLAESACGCKSSFAVKGS